MNKTETKIEKAIQNFENGFNCAQSVASVFINNEEEELILKTTMGFGAGMGQLQQTCGAVTGAYMILGIHHSNSKLSFSEQKKETALSIRSFQEKFIEKFDSDQCSNLIQCDLKTEQGQQEFKEKNMFHEVCGKCISEAIRILDDML